LAESITIEKRPELPGPEAPNFDGWACPVPLRNSPTIQMGHGGGGAMSAELVEHLFGPAFANPILAGLADSAVVTLGGARLAFSTDSYVVRPLFFPGGSIGELAVNGTVNDLAMSGAMPAYLSAGFILEEGTALQVIGDIAERMGAAVKSAIKRAPMSLLRHPAESPRIRPRSSWVLGGWATSSASVS